MQGQLHRGGDAGLFQQGLGLGGARVAVLVEEGVGVARDAGGDQRVQRFGLGAVDLGDEFAAVDELRHRLADGLGPYARVFGVEGEVADFQAGHVDEVDGVVGVGGQLLDLLGRHGAGHQVDVALVEGGAHLVGVREVAQFDLGVVHRQTPLVVGVLGEHGGDELVVLDLGLEGVRAGAVGLEAVAQLVLGVVVRVDDARDRGGQLEREGRVGGLEVEDDLAVALGLDGVDGGQQGEDATVGLEGAGAVDGVLDVGRGDSVAVGELEALAQGAGVALVAAVSEAAALGGLGHRVALAARLDHQGLHGLAEDVPGAHVVGVRRVEGGGSVLRGSERVRGADDDRVAAVTAAVGSATGGENRREQADDGRQHQSLAVHARVSPAVDSVYPACRGVAAGHGGRAMFSRRD